MVIITQPVRRYSFYRPTNGGRLSGPTQYSTGAQPVPKAVYRTGSREPWSSHTAVRRAHHSVTETWGRRRQWIENTKYIVTDRLTATEADAFPRRTFTLRRTTQQTHIGGQYDYRSMTAVSWSADDKPISVYSRAKQQRYRARAKHSGNYAHAWRSARHRQSDGDEDDEGEAILYTCLQLPLESHESV